MNRMTALTVALAITSIVSLAGCSNSADPDKAASPSPTRTSAANETVYNTCVDGLATIDAAHFTAEKPLDLGDCTHVSVLGAAKDGSTITLGAVEDLLIEASGATIHVDSAKSITVPGSDNTVQYSGETAVQDLGQGNTITAR
ncbi:hypothetical protein C1N91_02065 [Curtobacterium sp. SGAir0471]|uniref:DUF3060 domain-containing protein n=1 Tax=Curtobacterium sp. SGAir0471 TaxID=2070337 RepID=UPI0010CD3878|nr:DUF3060 domain-containing protein [Curtobacterium sp. SGAir0471]QCR42509.1 hypothetical protein C1N91_02065 [Curtobacterium sp. SGAir0471]